MARALSASFEEKWRSVEITLVSCSRRADSSGSVRIYSSTAHFRCVSSWSPTLALISPSNSKPICRCATNDPSVSTTAPTAPPPLSWRPFFFECFDALAFREGLPCCIRWFRSYSADAFAAFILCTMVAYASACRSASLSRSSMRTFAAASSRCFSPTFDKGKVGASMIDECMDDGSPNK